MSEGAEISKEMLKHGQMEFLDLLKQAGGEWLGSGKDGDESKGSSWISRMTGTDKNDNKSDDESPNDGSKPAEGSSWFGSSSSKPAEGSDSHAEQAANKEDGSPANQPGTVNSVADKVAASINSAAEAVMPVKPNAAGQAQVGKSSEQAKGPSASEQGRTL